MIMLNLHIENEFTILIERSRGKKRRKPQHLGRGFL